MKIKLEDIRFELRASTISKKGNVITVRKGFFYRMGGSAEKFAARVQAAYPGAKIIDSGEVWKAFRGGASVANQSHWWVKFEMPEAKQVLTADDVHPICLDGDGASEL